MNTKFLSIYLLVIICGCASISNNENTIVVVQPIGTETTTLLIFTNKIKEIKNDIKHYYSNDTSLVEIKKSIDSLFYYKDKYIQESASNCTTPLMCFVFGFTLGRDFNRGKFSVSTLFSYSIIYILSDVVAKEIIGNRIVKKEEVSFLNNIINVYNDKIVRGRIQ